MSLKGERLRYTLLMIFMATFSDFVFKESKQVQSTSLKDHIYAEVVVEIFQHAGFITQADTFIKPVRLAVVVTHPCFWPRGPACGSH